MNPITDGRKIAGFPAYRVTPDGSIWTCWKRANTLGNGHGYIMQETFKRMRLGKHKFGYHQVGLNIGNGKVCRRLVHALVLNAFVGPRPKGMQCRHLDGNPDNNHISNLVWGTARENQIDRRRHGTHKEGEYHPGAKRKAKVILRIIAALRSGAKQTEVAKEFKVHQGYISNIYRGKIWKCLQKEQP